MTLRVDATHAPAHPGASLMHDGNVIGTVTSGAWGHRVGRNLAYGFVAPAPMNVGTAFEVDMCGGMVPVQVIGPCPYDPQMRPLRS